MSKPISIRTTVDKDMPQRMILGGWLSGKTTYLWFGDIEEGALNTLSGYKLYRLAKAIVRQWEEDK